MTNSTESRGKWIGYWITTALTALAVGVGGVFDILRPEFVLEEMTKLGYPGYFCVIIGVWKVLGAVAILMPGFPLLKEWAYAGIVFDLTGAAASHFAVGDPPGEVAVPLVFTAITIASWYLRPASRRLPGV